MKKPYIIGIALVVIGIAYIFIPYMPLKIGQIITGMGIGCVLWEFFFETWS